VTGAIIVGGITLYKIQTDLAIIALHDCVEDPNPSVIEPHVLTPELLVDEPAHVADDTETTGTFVGIKAWN